MTAVLVAVVVIVGLLVAALAASVRVLREYERAVVFRLGRLLGQKGPGLVLLIPGIDRMVRVSLRTVTLNIPPQNVITCDNVPAHVDAVAYFRVVDPNRSVVDIEDAVRATSQIAQTTLRSVLGQHELDEMLSERERLNADVQQILDASTDAWGIKVSHVEIKHVDLDETMIRAIAKQAEAERTRRAKVIHAEGEKQAAAMLVEAAKLLGADPRAIQLRYMQTLSEIGAEQNSTIVFPLPIDLVKPLLAAGEAVTPEKAESEQVGPPPNGELPEGEAPAELPRAAPTPAVRTTRTPDRART